MPRILIIDDEHQVRRWLRTGLESAGYDVEDAPDGVKGLTAFKQRPADLVLTDIYMPEKEGLETIRELRRQNPELKIIAMSGGGIAGDFLPYAKKLGAVKTIEKPFDTELLLETVREVLGN
jgi:DNA-binding response OmpR family regulator